MPQAKRAPVNLTDFKLKTLKPDPAAHLEKDFAALIETVALAAGLKLSSENVPMPTGLETEE